MNPENIRTNQTENMPKEIETPEKIINVCQAVKDAGGQALIVGGWVRDKLLGLDSKDIDLEIFGLGKSKLEEALKKFGLTKEVGKTFGVYKIGDIDVALARLETKTGEKHTDFEVKTSPAFTPEQTSRRRDFTVNALMYDPVRSEVLDFHNGLADLDKKILRVVDEKTFIEDPLRVYRLASLSSRLGFEVEPKTQATCQQMMPELKHLPKERVSEEWKKILLSPNPSKGLKILEKLGILKQYFPEIDQMIGAKQDPIYHPEGDVWTHTLLALDYSASQKNKFTVRLATLLHDIGKPSQTEHKEDNRISHYKHESKEVAEPFIEQFLRRFSFNGIDNTKLRQAVVNLVADHMTIIRLTKNLDDNQIIDRSLRRLSVRLSPATLEQLIQLGQNDHTATQGEKDEFKGELLIERAQKLAVLDNQPKPYLTGKDLIGAGLTPGPEFGKILGEAYEQQLDGKISDHSEALQWFQKSYPQS
ncbi:MAG: tRNA nucleotidyltransferase (CCA-adding enzyme) [Candidatus Berkelbacteria bacterium Licking1014_7]|uniref:tRNA nucleotidyltransferase (CCA-adding enzyme) n=1 Tax=Candidatus Berkelbacteria bacterium Licking1014_7 TaxID=2017147 RepID=A0A554LII7_9BACT|nr:MAG: tRNA nucleotidyltransferase (CCA-adding enzyme) [Candidatus Berkelbacteria bacterium Licking1014_7]